MDPIQSWLDAKEVRRMAESLMAPAPKVDQSALDAGYGDDFEGFADAELGNKSKELQPNLPTMDGHEAAPVAAKPQFTQVPPEVKQPLIQPVIQPVIDTRPEPTVAVVEDSLPDESPAQGVGTTARIVVSHALADAKRMAEGSGMLSSGTQPLPSPVDEVENVPDLVLQPAITSPEPSDAEEIPAQPVATTSLTPQISPFQLCEDQSPEANVPVARQIDPSEVSTLQSEGDQAEIQAVFIPVPDETPVEQPKRVVLPSGPEKPILRPTSGAARGPFLTRLKGFSEQLRDRLGAKAMFLIDNEGQILIDEVGNTKLIQVARTLANASNTASRQTEGAADVGNLHVKIGASATLEVIPCRSRYGLLILGVVCPAPLGAERVRQVAEHLAKTVEPAGGV